MAKKYPKLRGRIIELYGNYKDFAEAINQPPSIVSRKLKTAFSMEEIAIWSKALKIEAEQVAYFFDITVS